MVAKEIKAATSDEEKSKEELPYSSSTSRVASTQIITTPQIGHKFNLLPESIKRCFYYSCLFPKRYEFEEEKLIQLWIAGGLVLPDRYLKEDKGRDIFVKLLWNSLFQRSSLVYPNGIPRYKVPDDVYDLVQQSCPDVFVTTADREPTATTLHSLLLLHHSNDTAIFKSLYESEMLRTLILLNEENHRSRIRQVPPDLFLRLRFLSAVDLSGTCIMELPTSIENLKHLAFLDLSYTPITILPDSICSLNHLLTLNLRYCSELIELPNSISKMLSLRHLDLEGARQLTSMPPSIGKLTNLRKLGTFVVGREEGCRIEELRNLNKLEGSLSIINLENVMDENGAKRVRLRGKKYLRKIEFQWSGVEWGRKAENVLNNLRPPSQVRELKILHYGGSTFPEWLSFSNLTTIILIGCGGCTHLPSLGELPNLTSLCIEEMHALKEINNYGLRKFGIPEFPRLMKLELDGMHELRKWWEIEVGDMPRLHKLTITDCPKLTTLPMLEWLPSLRHLEVTLCPKISSLPDGAPPNLRSLIIAESPKLEKRCRKGKGEDWHKIARVPDIWIHYKQISGIKTEHSQEQTSGSDLGVETQ
uniref:Disease resistance RPP13-like protein 1 n=1 Tax=Nelumbo nucifera TaxID=4432 RepID=A0A822XVY9_NELNU|nr:TPA_asm: hypothetical protein HUJ06_025961 [Nelumbo nucifera]